MTGERPGHGPAQPGIGLAARRSAQLDGRPLLLLPLGAVEQHGPHLPCGTDSMVAAAAARAAALRLHTRGHEVVVAPTLPYGASGEHEDFPGTVSIGHDALATVLVEAGRSACRWAAGLIFVNGHGGNLATVARAVFQLRAEGRPVAWTGCETTGADAHAGLTETSLLLYLSPSTVRLDLAEAGNTTPVATLLPRLRAEGVRAVTPNGVLGDPSASSSEHGQAVFAELVDRLVDELTALDVDDRGRLRRQAHTTTALAGTR